MVLVVQQGHQTCLPNSEWLRHGTQKKPGTLGRLADLASDLSCGAHHLDRFKGTLQAPNIETYTWDKPVPRGRYSQEMGLPEFRGALPSSTIASKGLTLILPATLVSVSPWPCAQLMP